MTQFLHTGADDADATLLFAHGAGAPMDSAFMESFARLLGERGSRVVRFEFAYMAARRETNGKRPPPRAEKLVEEYREAIAALYGVPRLVIGGKSLGGRVASLIVQEEWEAGRVAGLLCLGYPFHPPGKPEKLRTAHLLEMTAPALIVQGERDPFGNAAEVAGYGLPRNISMYWADDGDHGLTPRRASGRSEDDNWRQAADAITDWIRRLRPNAEGASLQPEGRRKKRGA